VTKTQTKVEEETPVFTPAFKNRGVVPNVAAKPTTVPVSDAVKNEEHLIRAPSFKKTGIVPKTQANFEEEKQVFTPTFKNRGVVTKVLSKPTEEESAPVAPWILEKQKRDAAKGEGIKIVREFFIYFLSFSLLTE